MPQPNETASTINWLTETSQALSSKIPETRDCNDHITERLTALLLERLPPPLAGALIETLPEDIRSKLTPTPLLSSAQAPADASIGYPDFVERAGQSLFCTRTRAKNHEASAEETELLCRRVADEFLWSVVKALPSEFKSRLVEVLPLELRSRMNLYNAEYAEARVA